MTEKRYKINTNYKPIIARYLTIATAKCPTYRSKLNVCYIYLLILCIYVYLKSTTFFMAANK